METINYTGQPIKAPEIENFEKITPEGFREYVEMVAAMRFQQRRFFTLRKPDALAASKELERLVDRVNAELLDPTPKLF